MKNEKETVGFNKKKVNPFMDILKWLVDVTDWKMLLRSVPGLVTAVFITSTVVMNLMAGKTIIMTNPSWLGITGGLLLSWIPFLCMDIVNKTYGAKAATKLNILALLVNLICVGIFQLISVIQVGGDSTQYTAFNSTFKQTWQILAASSIAFLCSGIINNVLNVGIGGLFKKDPDSKKAYAARTLVSTFVGQFVDNFMFTGLAFLVFFNISTGSTLGWTIWTTLGTAIFGAFLEFVMEAIFSPIGYRICKKWRAEGVGRDYLNYCKKMEVGNLTTRLNDKNEENSQIEN